MEEKKAKTLNGRPTTVAELNISQQDNNVRSGRVWSKLKRAVNKVNLVLAGMYTGVTCHGVPHEEHSYKEHKG